MNPTCFLVLAAVIFAASNACSSVAGPLIANPTFTFTFSPPVAWTYANSTESVYPGQETTLQGALNNVNENVLETVTEGLSRLGFSTGQASQWKQNGYNPQPILIVDSTNTTEAVNGTYIASGGTVLQQRTGNGPVTYSEDITIGVTGQTLALYSSQQWGQLADQVVSLLAIRYRVRFLTPVTIGGQ